MHDLLCMPIITLMLSVVWLLWKKRCSTQTLQHGSYRCDLYDTSEIEVIVTDQGSLVEINVCSTMFEKPRVCTAGVAVETVHVKHSVKDENWILGPCTCSYSFEFCCKSTKISRFLTLLGTA